MSRGVHIVVGTLGRLSDLLNQRKLQLDFCKFVVLDDADKLLDDTFEEELHYLFNKLEVIIFQNQRKIILTIKPRRQVVILSSTFHEKFNNFVKKNLSNPIVVSSTQNRGMNLNVIQEIEYVRSENKLAHLLETLKKTPPPVLIFGENKHDVDTIYESLLFKGVDAASLHSSKSIWEIDILIYELK